MTMQSLQEWTEVRVVVPCEWQELVGGWMCEVTGNGSAFGPASLATDPAPAGHDFVRSFFPTSEDTEARRTELTRSLAELAERSCVSELSGLTLVFSRLPAEDYANSWRKSWKPFRLGRMCVVAPDSTYVARAGEVLLRLEPGGAFGTGRHPTTRACLRALQERLVPGSRVLDAGSGSGILCVGAMLLGAKSALGFDTDRWAAPYAKALAQSNGALAGCSFRTGGFETLTEEDSTFDVVLANIYSDVIQAHAQDLAQRLRPGGWFAFSGCPDRHASPTRSAIEAAGLVVESREQRGRWCSFIGVRP